MKPAPHLQLLPPLAAAAPAEADDTLGVRAREGDLGAWSEVYARHYGRLLRQLRHLTGDLAVAEELAQETFAQAMAISYPASACRQTPEAGSFHRTLSSRFAASGVPSARITTPARTNQIALER